MRPVVMGGAPHRSERRPVVLHLLSVLPHHPLALPFLFHGKLAGHGVRGQGFSNRHRHSAALEGGEHVAVTVLGGTIHTWRP